MSSAEPAPVTVSAADVERWLADLGIAPLERIEHEGITSWDLDLDGRRRYDIRATLILDPALALIIWVQYAPPITDYFRKSYRKLLRWNDEFPFAKFAISEDERPILAGELPVMSLDRDELGIGLARLLAICDRLVEDSAGWIWSDGRVPDRADRVSRQTALFARYAERLGELSEP
jgi:hypothetical protein